MCNEKVWRVEFEVEAETKADVVKLFDRVEDTRKAQVLSDEYIDLDDELKARIGYNKKEDAFELLISTDGGRTWGMSESSKCRKCDIDKPDAEPMFIHCGLIDAMKNAIRYGYRIVY